MQQEIHQRLSHEHISKIHSAIKKNREGNGGRKRNRIVRAEIDQMYKGIWKILAKKENSNYRRGGRAPVHRLSPAPVSTPSVA